MKKCVWVDFEEDEILKINVNFLKFRDKIAKKQRACLKITSHLFGVENFNTLFFI